MMLWPPAAKSQCHSLGYGPASSSLPMMERQLGEIGGKLWGTLISILHRAPKFLNLALIGAAPKEHRTGHPPLTIIKAPREKCFLFPGDGSARFHGIQVFPLQVASDSIIIMSSSQYYFFSIAFGITRHPKVFQRKMMELLQYLEAAVNFWPIPCPSRLVPRCGRCCTFK